MSRAPLRGRLRPVLTDSPLTSTQPLRLRRSDDRLAPVCPPLADHSTPGTGANALGSTVCAHPVTVLPPVTNALARGRAGTARPSVTWYGSALLTDGATRRLRSNDQTCRRSVVGVFVSLKLTKPAVA